MDSLTSVVLVGLLVVGVAVWGVCRREAEERRAERDSDAAAVLLEGFRAVLSQELPARISEHRGIGSVHLGLRLGEVARHFDSDTSATIKGWLVHDLGFHAWGAGAVAGRVGMALGRSGLSGVSQADFTYIATTSDNLMSDAFVAVLERDTPGGTDTLRIVVPSEAATRKLVNVILEEALGRFTRVDGSGRTVITHARSYATLTRLMPELLGFRDEASYVSDRLHAIMRVPTESRPPISVYGSKVGEHAIVAAAIELGDANGVNPLFPLDLITSVKGVVDHALLVAQAA